MFTTPVPGRANLSVCEAGLIVQEGPLLTYLHYLMTMLSRAYLPRLLAAVADCAVCAEHFSARIGYSCGECDERTKRPAVGLVVTALVVVVLVAALALKDLQSGLKDDTREEINVRERFTARKFTIFLSSLMKVLPLTAIKIVVVVWQIVSQVRRVLPLDDVSVFA